MPWPDPARRTGGITLDAPEADVGGIHLIYAPDRSPPAKVKVMIEFLVAAFNPLPPWAIQRPTVGSSPAGAY